MMANIFYIALWYRITLWIWYTSHTDKYTMEYQPTIDNIPLIVAICFADIFLCQMRTFGDNLCWFLNALTTHLRRYKWLSMRWNKGIGLIIARLVCFDTFFITSPRMGRQGVLFSLLGLFLCLIKLQQQNYWLNP